MLYELNTNTRKAKQYINNYKSALRASEMGYNKYTSVLEFYQSPSHEKIVAEMALLNEMRNNNGCGYIVTGGNSCTFSAAYIFKNKNSGKKTLCYNTAHNTYHIEI